jgi:hypothetical protein
MKHLMQVLKATSEDPKVISLAIDVVAVARDDHLASQLIEFLLGELDGIPKVSAVTAIGISLRLAQQQTRKKYIFLRNHRYFKPFFPSHYKVHAVCLSKYVLNCEQHCFLIFRMNCNQVRERSLLTQMNLL